MREGQRADLGASRVIFADGWFECALFRALGVVRGVGMRLVDRRAALVLTILRPNYHTVTRDFLAKFQPELVRISTGPACLPAVESLWSIVGFYGRSTHEVFAKFLHTKCWKCPCDERNLVHMSSPRTFPPT